MAENFLWFHSRRAVIWKNLKGLRVWSAFGVASFFGVGLLPFAPGTFGTLAAIPLVWVLSSCSWSIRLGVWAGVLVIGSWAAQVFDEAMGTSDNQNTVIDEVLGLGIASLTVSSHWMGIFAAALLFRFFDIVKLPPVRQLDQWSRNKTNGSSSFLKGFGVMADDAVAGLQSLLVLWILQQWLKLS